MRKNIVQSTEIKLIQNTFFKQGMLLFYENVSILYDVKKKRFLIAKLFIVYDDNMLLNYALYRYYSMKNIV